MALYESFMILSRGFRQGGAGRKEGKASDLGVRDIPTVVDCHEIPHKKEWVGQHADSDLKAQKTTSPSVFSTSEQLFPALCMLVKLSSSLEAS